MRDLAELVPDLFFAVGARAAPGGPRPWAAQSVHPDDEPKLERCWAAALASGAPFRSMVRLRCESGGYRCAEVRVLPLRTEGGLISGWVATKADSLRTSHPDSPCAIDLLRAVCDTANDSIFVKDNSGLYLYVNPACAALFEASADEVIGSDDDRWFGPEIGRKLRAEDSDAITRGAVTRDEELDVGGRRYVFSTTKVPFRDEAGRVAGVVGIARNIEASRAEARATRLERDFYAAMTAVVPGAFLSYRRRRDGSHEIPYASASIADLVGATPDELRADATIPFSLTHPQDRLSVAAAVARSAETLLPLRCECRLLHPKRGEIWLELAAGPIREPDGSTLWHGFVLDVTDRKRVERALDAERDRLAGIAASSPGALFAFRRSADGSVSFPYASSALSQIYGLPLETILDDGARALALVHPEDSARVYESIEHSAKTMTPWRCEFRVINPQRGEIWVEGHSQPARDADGGITWNGIVTDITERRSSEARLRASESRLRAIVDTVPDHLMLVDRDRKIQFINRLLPGLAMRDVIGTDVLSWVDPALAESARATMDDVFGGAGMQTYEGAAGTAGDMRWFNTRIGPVIDDGEVVAVTLSSTDITARRLAEERVLQSEARYRKLVDLLPDALFVHTGGRISLCNSAFQQMMGASSPDQLLGLRPFDVVHKDHHQLVAARIAAIHATGEPAPPVDVGIVTLDGQRRRVRVVAALIDKEAPESFLVLMHDITERQRTEHLLESVLESVSDAILTIDDRSVIRAVNPAAVRLFGHSAETMIGHDVGMLMPEPFPHMHHTYMGKMPQANGTAHIGRGREVQGKRADGTTFPIEISVASFMLDGARHFTGVVRDITERKKLEDQFRQAHKMEAFGQLAGGVAHDFNNLLTVILGETELLVSTARPDDPMSDSLTAVYEAGQRAAGLTKQLLAFSRRTVLEPRVLDINSVVRETEKMLRRLIGEDIRLSTKLVPNLRHVDVDPSQLGQVLMNMAVNARDAMPKGGTLEIETSNVSFDDEGARARGLRAGAYVKLSVRDSGIGMSPEVLERIFQPFFTTKAVGRGTGLGLAVVHGIVTQSGGAISVESKEGRGTAFDMWLPVARSKPAAASDGPPPADQPQRGTLLVVEDDDAVRRLAMRALGARGYDVLFARDGADALALLESREGALDLLITDVVMPNMGGRELKQAVDDRFPGLRVLYVSGYTEDVLVRRGVQSDSVNFLAKPYTPSSLIEAVRRALAAPVTSAA